MDRKPNNVIVLKSSLNGKFFRMWLEFLRPFHKLTEREMDVLSVFLKERFDLSKVVSDQEILDKLTMGEDTKRKIREECNITLPHFQVVMGELRNSKFIDNNSINPKFIPNLNDSGSFKLLVYYRFND